MATRGARISISDYIFKACMRWPQIFARAARADILFFIFAWTSSDEKHGNTVEETIGSHKFKAWISTHGPEKHPWSPGPQEQNKRMYTATATCRSYEKSPKNMKNRFLVPREEETSRELPTQRLLSLMQKDTTYVTSGGADMYCEGTYKTSAKSPTFFKKIRVIYSTFPAFFEKNAAALDVDVLLKFRMAIDSRRFFAAAQEVEISLRPK